VRAIQSHDPERLPSCRFPRPCEHESPSFSLFFGKSGKTQASHPFALSSSPSASTETGTLARSHDDSFWTRPHCFSTAWSRDAFDRRLPSNHLLQYLHPCSRFSNRLFRHRSLRRWAPVPSKGGAVSRCPFPVLVGRAATRAGLDRRSSVHDFTKDIPSPSSTPSTARIEIASGAAP
jgi:hypothetical protein